MEQVESTVVIEPASPLLRIEAILVSKLNLADFQNAVPLLRELIIVNDSEVAIQSLELEITSVPAFLKSKTWRIEEVGAGKSFALSDLDIKLDGTLLSRLTEAEKASVTLVLRYSSDVRQELARLDWTVELLPRNQWGGLSHFPDMVAAFVQPNEPAVERLLKQTAEILRKSGKNAALDGYKGGPKRAWELVSGIWSVVAGMGLDYALPPASFEHAGQKVRGAAQIAESGLATCLDLALLFCSAIEQTGLNPLLIFTKGHAFVGVWLKPEEFSTTVVDDITALRKRIKLNELVIFETTVVTQRPAPLFSFAIQLGTQHISEEKEEAFELAVDIRRARLQRIKPLASAENHVVEPQENPPIGAPVIEDAPDLPDNNIIPEPDTATLNPKDRLARWQRKLLDLSLRNNLLNFRSGKKALKLEAPDPGALEDLLSDGTAVKLLSRPDLMDGSDPRDLAIYEGREREDVRREHALDALKRREIFVATPQEELDARLVELYRTAKNTLQEGGANTLFLAIGFLSWTRDDKSGQRYRAPLILVPVTLNRKSVRSGFTLVSHDDEPRFNPTLIEMLRQDFKLNLGIADGELPKDDAGLDVAAIWKAVSHAVKDIKGWEVTEDVVLAMFSFAKYLMWKDLAERTDQLRENAVVRHLIDTPREQFPSGVAFPAPNRLDREFGPEKTFCPLPADSSQLSAVMAAVRGKDFVLIGPPGTGKSQTISNLIAQCLAEGKRVLFVSEKIAALDVVYRRLREVGLGEFCLELHSSKARKLDVLAQLGKSWAARGNVDPDVWRAEAVRLQKLRDGLNVYVERLHFRFSNGLTIFDAIGCIADGKDVPAVRLSWSAASAHDSEAMEVMRDVVGRLEVNALAVGQDALQRGPLAAVDRNEWSPSWQQTLVESARAVIPLSHAVEQAYDRFCLVAGLPVVEKNQRARKALEILAKTLPNCAGRNWRFVLRPDVRVVAERLSAGAHLLIQHRELSAALTPQWLDDDIFACQSGLLLLQQRKQVFAAIGKPWTQDSVEIVKQGLLLLDDLANTSSQLSVKYGEQVEQLNVNLLQREWVKSERSMWPMSWLGKRAIRKQLDATVVGEGEPNCGVDLNLWVKIRTLRSEISALDAGTETASIWQGLKTKQEIAQCALRFQAVLDAARHERPWEDSGLEIVANGRCGEKLAKELANLQALQRLDAEINSLDHLMSVTGNLWDGLATQTERLEAALLFLFAMGEVRESGIPAGDHLVVAQGGCGTAFTENYRRLHRRAKLELQLTEFDDLHEITAGLWNGLKTHTEEVELALKFQSAISAALANIANTPEQVSAIKEPLGQLLGEGNSLLEAGGPIANAGSTYLTAYEALLPVIAQLAAAGHFSEESKIEYGDGTLSDLMARCAAIIQAESRLHTWCAWRKVREQAVSSGMESLVAAIESGMFEVKSVRRVFETNYARWWLNAVVDEEPVIRGFVSAEHEKRINDFRELDDHFTDLTRAWVRAGLCAELPTQDGVTKNSEWGILKHEMSKKKRHMPLRELVSRIPSALTKLTPCLLMSPLSIAQYLAADATTFDVVVFDEASQIPVWDAVGAIARGKQVVMVGDPKQLPPTNFFDRAESDLDDEDVEGDLESILDECLGANLPTMNLAWHYRSRHESLIAFSNHRYYGGGLVTFPSPVTEDRAVSFHHIDGVYEKGGARINKPEAFALVADLVSRLKSPGFRASKLSIGVVTFNTEQQALIEDLLDEERRKDITLESYFAEMELEPVFVKNLESVQGDERDIMYFSITYGPDIHGAVSMNFGPMNRDGGERRLNVAITRARHELRVFSSLKAEQMDLSRTQSLGVRDLKHFLDFADRGPRALAEAPGMSRGDFESPFEEAVAVALTRKGWQLHTQVGASDFRIDLAVVHPDAAGVYLTGIECDGATYHRSATARDRDKLREQVLRGLGWEILRVWSTDWWIDAEDTLNKLDTKLRGLLEASREKRALEVGETAARVPEVKKEVIEGTVAISPVKDIDGASGVREDAGSDSETVNSKEDVLQPAELYSGHVSDSTQITLSVFVESDPASVVSGVNPDAFFDQKYDHVLVRMIDHVIEIEGPVLDAVLARRIARAHGWQRTGARIQERIDSLASKSHQVTLENVGTFYWKIEMDLTRAVPFRRVYGPAIRNVDEICMPELISLGQEVLNRGQTDEAALVAMSRELGLQRLRAASRDRVGMALMQAALN
jgi:very-short-patch-repair endonuclease